jgi:hypothetical protein
MRPMTPFAPLKSARWRNPCGRHGQALRLAHPAHSRTKPEEADIRCATKTAQLLSLSTVLPFGKFDGFRWVAVAPVSSSQRRMRSFEMSLHSRQRASPNQTGPSAQRQPVLRPSIRLPGPARRSVILRFGREFDFIPVISFARPSWRTT